MEVTVTFIGNATTLISCGGVTLLTDPNFLHQGQRAYLGGPPPSSTTSCRCSQRRMRQSGSRTAGSGHHHRYLD